jgi:hypothetical protein
MLPYLQTHTPVPSNQHTSAYGSIRQNTPAYVSIRQHTYVSPDAHTSALKHPALTRDTHTFPQGRP